MTNFLEDWARAIKTLYPIKPITEEEQTVKAVLTRRLNHKVEAVERAITRLANLIEEEESEVKRLIVGLKTLEAIEDICGKDSIDELYREALHNNPSLFDKDLVDVLEAIYNGDLIQKGGVV